MAVGVSASPASIDASRDLLKKCFSVDESRLPNLVFGTNQPPFPFEFCEPQSQLAIEVGEIVVGIMMSTTISFMFKDLQLNADQVHQLDVKDPRIATLKQRIFDALGRQEDIQKLRAQRMEILRFLNSNNFTLGVGN